MSVAGRFLTWQDDISDAYSIIEKVYKERSGIYSMEELEKDEDVSLYVLINEVGRENKPVAAGRIMLKEQSCFLTHIAVLKEYRGNQFGDLVVRMLINKAFEMNFEKVQLITPIDIKPFFENIGFKANEIIPAKNGSNITMLIGINEMIKKCKIEE